MDKNVKFVLVMQETPSLYIALLHGDLFLWLGDVKSSPVFTSSNGTFADNSWYALRFTSTADRYVINCQPY